MTQTSLPLPRHPRAVGGSAGTRQRSSRVVHQLLRSSIKSGILHHGESLSEESLVELLHTTRSAVRFALQLLADEGLVTRQRRVGTVVDGKPIQIPMQDVVDEEVSGPLEYRLTGDHVFPAHVLIRSRMPTQQEKVRMIEYVISSGDILIGTLVAFQISPHLQMFEHKVKIDNIATTFREIYGKPFGRMETCIDAVNADDATATLLGIPPGSLMLVRDQILSDADGHIHEFAYAHYRADLVSFRS